MRIRGRDYAIDWGHLIFATLMAATALWYLMDARSVSLSVSNLLLVEPVAIFALLMYVLILPQIVRPVGADAAPDETLAADDPLAPALPTERSAILRIAVLGAALGAFVFALIPLGFDVAIWLFSLITMLVCGERRPLSLLLYPLAVTVVAVYGFRALMNYPMPTAVL